jgi:hypothetical protein
MPRRRLRSFDIANGATAHVADSAVSANLGLSRQDKPAQFGVEEGGPRRNPHGRRLRQAEAKLSRAAGISDAFVHAPAPIVRCKLLIDLQLITAIINHESQWKDSRG